MPLRPMAGMSLAAGNAAADLGLGDLLADQVGAETDELRKKRLAQAQQREQMGPAAFSLFGGSPLGGMGGGLGY